MSQENEKEAMTFHLSDLKVLPEKKDLELVSDSAEIYDQTIGYNQYHDEAIAIPLEVDVEALRDIIQETKNAEAVRNGHSSGHKYSPVCSCGKCLMSHLLAANLATHLPKMIRRKK